MTLGSGALGQSVENYFQVRYFYPPPFASSALSGLTLDAALRQQFGDLTLGLKLEGVGLTRQRLGLELSSPAVFGLVEYSGEPLSGGASKSGLTVVGSYRPTLPDNSKLLSELGLVYVYQAEGGPSSYSLHAGQLSARGNFSPDFGYKLGYGLDFLSAAGIADKLDHSLKLDLNGRLAPVELGLSTSLKLGSSLTYGLGLAVKAPITEHETVSAAANLSGSSSSSPTDTETLTLSSTRLEPVSLGLSVGRAEGGTGTYTLGLSAEYPFSEALTGSLSYGTSVGGPGQHDLEAEIAYREGGLSGRAQVGTSFAHDEVGETWQGSYRFKLSGAYRLAPLTFSARGSLDLRPTRTSGSLSGSLAWVPTDLPVSASLDLGFSFAPTLSGTASAQLLYRITDSLSLNVSGAYRQDQTTTTSGVFSAGLGLRFRF